MSATGDVCVAHVLGFTDRKTVGALGEGECRFPRTLAQEGDASVVSAHIKGHKTEAGDAGENFWWDTWGSRMRALPVIASRWLKTTQSVAFSATKREKVCSEILNKQPWF